MDDENLPRAVWEGELHIFGATVKCHVLDDGRRIFDEESFAALLDALGDQRPMSDTDAGDVHRLAQFVNGRGVPPSEAPQ